MKTTAKQVRAAFNSAIKTSDNPTIKSAMRTFVNSISDIVDSEEMVWGEVLACFADDLAVAVEFPEEK